MAELEELTRREFLLRAGKIAGVIIGASVLSFPSQSIALAEETKEAKVYIYNSLYKGYILADNLKRLSTVAINPASNQVYFIGRDGDESSIAIRTFRKGLPAFFLSVEGKSWGGYMSNKMAINNLGQMFVYYATNDENNMTIYDLKSGRCLFEKKLQPRHKNGKCLTDHFFVGSVAANPITNDFYMSGNTDTYLNSLNVSDRTMKVHEGKGVYNTVSMTFDLRGNLFISDLFTEILKKYDGATWKQIEFSNLRKVVGDCNSFTIGGLATDRSTGNIVMWGYPVAKNYLEKGGTIFMPNFILSCNTITGQVTPLACMHGGKGRIEGLDFDTKGNIYFSTSNHTLPFSEEKGKIYMLKKVS